jgi:hypothetical protein
MKRVYCGGVEHVTTTLSNGSTTTHTLVSLPACGMPPDFLIVPKVSATKCTTVKQGLEGSVQFRGHKPEKLTKLGKALVAAFQQNILFLKISWFDPSCDKENPAIH